MEKRPCSGRRGEGRIFFRPGGLGRPLVRKSPLAPDSSGLPRAQDKSVTVGKAAKVGGSWLALAFVTKLLMDQNSRSKNVKRRKTLETLVNARYPSITPDTDLEDTEAEKKLREAGLAKESAEDSISPFASISKAIKSVGRTDLAPWQLALTVAAMVGGSKMGWSLASKMGKTREKNQRR